MRTLVLFWCCIVLMPSAQAAFTPPPNDGYVTDTIHMLTPEQEQQIEDRLKTYRDATSNEIAILILKNTEGNDIADVAVDTGRAWGVGTEKNNGIMMVVSYEDRNIFLATGYGLEGAVPDIVAKGIIETDITPAFREGKYFEGLMASIDSLEKHIGGEYTADRYAESDGSGWGWVFFVIFILFDVLAAMLGRTKSWWLGGVLGGVFGVILTIFFAWWLSIPALIILGLIFDYIVSKIGPRGRGGRGGPFIGGMGSGGSSGGFGGFGGGSFGGGGASGKW